MMSDGRRPTAAALRHYRFGFVLSTALGNMTRYVTLRKYVERDEVVEAVWAPVSHFIEPGSPDPFARWPGILRDRAIVLSQASPVVRQLSSLDGVLIHQFEVDLLLAARALLLPEPPRFVSGDDAPALHPDSHPMHPHDRAKPLWRQRLRRSLDIWRARQADTLIPFSHWASDLLLEAGARPADVHPIHTGLDLDVWRRRPDRPIDARRAVRFLFVGGEFERKGGPTLLEAFVARFPADAELDIVTKSAPRNLPPSVRVHSDLGPNDPRLRALYLEADVLVHPTTSDLSGWVVLEGMASSCPAIVTDVGGVPELVEDGATGSIVPVGDADRLGAAMLDLARDPVRRKRMGERARQRVERHFDAAINVSAILSIMKGEVDARRQIRNTARRA